MTIMKSITREPADEPLSAILQRAAAPPDLSQEAKDHLTRVESIAANALKDLEDVSIDVDKLRDEITLRARMIAEATIRLDELQRKAGTAYGTIRSAIEMIRQEFADIPATAPDFDNLTND
jgi:DNA repair ATPase RecN